MSKATTLRAYYFASYASIGVFLPFVSPWLVSLGMKGTAMGVIAATRPLAGIVAPVLFGWLADSLGLRGGILKLACLGACLPFFAIAAMAYQGLSLSFPELLIAVAVSSFFRVPMMTIADVSALEHKRSYGSLRLFGTLGFMAAALLAGRFVDPTRAVEFPAAVAGAFLLSFALSFGFPNRVAVPQRPTRADVRELLRRPAFVALLLVTTIWACSHVAYDLCISLLLKDLGASPFTTSIAWNIGALAEIGLMAFWSKLKLSWPSELWLKLGLAATAVRFFGLAFATQLQQVLWLQPLHALSFALVWMALMEQLRERAPTGLLGTAQGLFSAAVSVGATLGMLVFAPLYEKSPSYATFAIAGGIAVLALGATAFAPSMTLRQDAVER